MSKLQKFILAVPGDPYYLKLVRQVVTYMADAAGLDSDGVDSIERAVDEACTNILDHSYSSKNPKPPVHIEIEADESNLVIDIIDQGDEFDFYGQPTPKFPQHWEDGNTRGVGIFLIKRSVDETHYETLPDERNRLRLVKRISE